MKLYFLAALTVLGSQVCFGQTLSKSAYETSTGTDYVASTADASGQAICPAGSSRAAGVNAAGTKVVRCKSTGSSGSAQVSAARMANGTVTDITTAISSDYQTYE